MSVWKKMFGAGALLTGCGVLGVAMAEGWSDYLSTFPAQPCTDGWTACLVDEEVLNPGVVLDGAGHPHPSDMRFGFYDFEVLPAGDPFAAISDYTDSPEGARATRKAEAREAAAPEARRAPAGQRSPSTRTATTTSGSSGRSATTTASSSSGSTGRAEQPVASSGSSSASTRPAYSTPTPVAAEETTYNQTQGTTREERHEAAARPEAESTAEASRTAAPVEESAPVAAAAPAPPSAVASGGSVDCDDLVSLEAPAMMGKLGVGRRKCLEGRLGASSVQTQKNKMSRVLIADAEARGDRPDWERLMKRHLEDIDRSDPNMCFKYAIHLSRGGAGRAHGVIRWTEYALENKHQWSGNTYKKNVNGLYKLRAQGANNLWQSAEKKFVDDRSEKNEAKTVKYRGMTKDYSREWLDYARASGMSTKQPMALCVSAAGSTEFCQG